MRADPTIDDLHLLGRLQGMQVLLQDCLQVGRKCLVRRNAGTFNGTIANAQNTEFTRRFRYRKFPPFCPLRIELMLILWMVRVELMMPEGVRKLLDGECSYARKGGDVFFVSTGYQEHP